MESFPYNLKPSLVTSLVKICASKGASIPSAMKLSFALDISCQVSNFILVIKNHAYAKPNEKARYIRSLFNSSFLFIHTLLSFVKENRDLI